MPLTYAAAAAFLLAQYFRRASDSFARYSGVSHPARLALNASEFMVSLSRALRCSSAAGSDIFSRRLGCAALIPSTLFAFISGSVLSILWYSRIGLAGSIKRLRFALMTSGLGLMTPSPPSVKLASVPPSFSLPKCAIKDCSMAQAVSQSTFKNRCTRTFSGPYFCTNLKQCVFRSLALIRSGFHRLGVLPIPT